jgi:hypothetical protein
LCAGAVERRLEGTLMLLDARLRDDEREQVAALDLVLVVNQRCEARPRQLAAHGAHAAPACGRARREELGVGPEQLDRDLLEPERAPDRLADGVQERVRVQRFREPRRDVHKVLERSPVTRVAFVLLRALDRQRHARRP